WYYLKATGAMATGWKQLGKNWYYLNESGAMATGWKQLGKSWYYLNASGAMATGWKKLGGSWYYLNASGAMATGWKKLGGSWYYLNPVSGAAAKGERTVDGAAYYFNGNCQMVTGWHNWAGTNEWSYFYASGHRASGTKTIDGTKYTFDANGRTKTAPIPGHQQRMNAKAQSFSSNTSWLILVDRDSKHVGIYRGSKGNWTCVKYWLCCVGKPSSPTITGSYTVSGKGLSFGDGYTCWYYTQIKGNYLFHSVSYLPGSKTQLLDGRLGVANSKGCVRLEISNAKWMYDNVPYGSKIYIY
ncbi:L,D-transpeptidase family protein, partial [Parvibacter caecicola]|uniref:L,D-transpeptidase family protein n=1 Tax=Parvibacter caecicola TaxID=747645 RepID=UPI00272EEC22